MYAWMVGEEEMSKGGGMAGVASVPPLLQHSLRDNGGELIAALETCAAPSTDMEW